MDLKLKTAPKSKDIIIQSDAGDMKQEIKENIADNDNNRVRYECERCAVVYTGFYKDLAARSFIYTHSQHQSNKCEVCSEKFHSMRLLMRHLKTAHSIDEKLKFYSLASRVKKNKVVNWGMNEKLCGSKIDSDKVPGLCQYCGYKSTNNRTLRWHLRTYHTKQPFQCKVCGKSLATSHGLTSHIRLHEKPRPRAIQFICDDCGKTFKRKKTLKTHIYTHTGMRPHECKVCKKTFAKRETLRQHLLTHTGKRPYCCDICSKTFVQKPALTAHRKSHPGNLPPMPVVFIDSFIREVDPSMVHEVQIAVPKCRRLYRSKSSRGKTMKPAHECVKCGAHFFHMTKLVEHLRNAHGIENAFKCDECGKKFRSPVNIARHKLIHTGVKTFSCNICDYNSNQKANLDLHRRRHIKDFTFGCSTCDKKFLTKSDLIQHKNIHASIKYRCHICGKSYSYKKNLMAHSRLSHQVCPIGTKHESNHKCKFCSHTFSSPEQLKYHMKTHQPRNIPISCQFLCELCGIKVSSKRALEMHIRIHTGEKIFTCETCDRGFSTRECLKVHQRTHTGEKPYVCSECGKAFTQRTSLVIHLRYHTGERPYWCLDCGKRFVIHSFLKKHQKIHTVR